MQMRNDLAERRAGRRRYSNAKAVSERGQTWKNTVKTEPRAGGRDLDVAKVGGQAQCDKGRAVDVCGGAMRGIALNKHGRTKNGQ